MKPSLIYFCYSQDLLWIQTFLFTVTECNWYKLLLLHSPLHKMTQLPFLQHWTTTLRTNLTVLFSSVWEEDWSGIWQHPIPLPCSTYFVRILFYLFCKFQLHGVTVPSSLTQASCEELSSHWYYLKFCLNWCSTQQCSQTLTSILCWHPTFYTSHFGQLR